MEIRDDADMLRAAKRICDGGCNAVLIKAGHLAGPPVDLLFEANEVTRFGGTRIESRNTHGTGCTLSAAITANLALGLDLKKAVQRAKSYVQTAIETAPGLGSGFGPLNHWA
jgi:hydroxymethylpyrimidine/phosphomethylpyrimidine kinase